MFKQEFEERGSVEAKMNVGLKDGVYLVLVDQTNNSIFINLLHESQIRGAEVISLVDYWKLNQKLKTRRNLNKME